MFETELLEIHSRSIRDIDFNVFNGGISGANFVCSRMRPNREYEY